MCSSRTDANEPSPGSFLLQAGKSRRSESLDLDGVELEAQHRKEEGAPSRVSRGQPSLQPAPDFTCRACKKTTDPNQGVLGHVGGIAELPTDSRGFDVGVWVVERFYGGLKVLQPFPHAHDWRGGGRRATGSLRVQCMT